MNSIETFKVQNFQIENQCLCQINHNNICFENLKQQHQISNNCNKLIQIGSQNLSEINNNYVNSNNQNYNLTQKVYQNEQLPCNSNLNNNNNSVYLQKNTGEKLIVANSLEDITKIKYFIKYKFKKFYYKLKCLYKHKFVQFQDMKFNQLFENSRKIITVFNNLNNEINQFSRKFKSFQILQQPSNIHQDISSKLNAEDCSMNIEFDNNAISNSKQFLSDLNYNQNLQQSSNNHQNNSEMNIFMPNIRQNINAENICQITQLTELDKNKIDQNKQFSNDLNQNQNLYLQNHLNSEDKHQLQKNEKEGENIQNMSSNPHVEQANSNQIKYQCTCSKIFKRYAGLQAHTKTVHGAITIEQQKNWYVNPRKRGRQRKAEY